MRMGETLSPGRFSFRNRTIREYSDANGKDDPGRAWGLASAESVIATSRCVVW
jgi:hypothetical protein